MIVVLALLFRLFLKERLVTDARAQAEKGLRGYMDGHANMDMSVAEGTLARKIFSSNGFTAISHLFVMDWASVIRDIALGLLIAGALAAWVPESFWSVFFLSDEPRLAFVWGPIVGPVVSIVSFVCSIGNVPLAAVLWYNGISFGGVISFIFADLLILPILSIKRRYYGTRMTLFLFGTFYVAMAVAGLVVEVLFGALGLIPQERNALVAEPSFSLNHTTGLNVLFMALAGVLLVRAWRTGGFAMLAMMNPKAT
jgi:uncharacterized membrane protein YraQ (UPF0718 family)